MTASLRPGRRNKPRGRPPRLALPLLRVKAAKPMCFPCQEPCVRCEAYRAAKEKPHVE